MDSFSFILSDVLRVWFENYLKILIKSHCYLMMGFSGCLCEWIIMKLTKLINKYDDTNKVWKMPLVHYVFIGFPD